jgi:hypothetical protein
LIGFHMSLSVELVVVLRAVACAINGQTAGLRSRLTAKSTNGGT